MTIKPTSTTEPFPAAADEPRRADLERRIAGMDRYIAALEREIGEKKQRIELLEKALTRTVTQ